MYAAFQFVGALCCIATQRELERNRLLQGESNKGEPYGWMRLLLAGIGDGGEAVYLLKSCDHSARRREVIAVDIVDGMKLPSVPLPSLKSLGARFHFMTCDICSLPNNDVPPGFDVVQCGFLFHELTYGRRKARGVRACRDLLKPGGLLLISDTFLDNRKTNDARKERRRRALVRSFYEGILREVHDALQAERLSPQQRDALLGDGTCPGLLHSYRMALAGEDDFYEPLPTFLNRLRRFGFKRICVYDNPVNQFMKVITATI